MRGKVNFLIKFLMLTFVFFLIWIPLGEKYLILLAWVSKYVLWVMAAILILKNLSGINDPKQQKKIKLQ